MSHTHVHTAFPSHMSAAWKHHYAEEWTVRGKASRNLKCTIHVAMSVFLQENTVPSKQGLSEQVSHTVKDIRQTPNVLSHHECPSFPPSLPGESREVTFDTVIFLPFNLPTSSIPDTQKHCFKSWASLSFQARQFPFCLINKEINTWKKVKGVRNLRP